MLQRDFIATYRLNRDCLRVSCSQPQHSLTNHRCCDHAVTQYPPTFLFSAAQQHLFSARYATNSHLAFFVALLQLEDVCCFSFTGLWLFTSLVNKGCCSVAVNSSLLSLLCTYCKCPFRSESEPDWQVERDARPFQRRCLEWQTSSGSSNRCFLTASLYQIVSPIHKTHVFNSLRCFTTFI